MANVALVAGVGRGTGGAVARRFAAGGYKVALVARSLPRLKEFEAELPGSLALACDITDPAALTDMLARCRADLGEPDVVIHNARLRQAADDLDLDRSGFVLLDDATDNPTFRPRPLLKYPAWAAPILSHGLLYVRGSDRLVCLELIPE